MSDPIGLPIDLMLRDARAEDPSDMACHVYALVDEVRRLNEACAIAYCHLDTYSVPGGHPGARKIGQDAALAALKPFVRSVAGLTVPLYERGE